MTAIADIIVNQSNPANLQLSQSIKDSLNSNSTTSFADMVSFYKDAQKEEAPVEAEAEAPVTKSETTETKEKTVAEKTEEKAVEKDSDTKEKSVKTEVKGDAKVAKDEAGDKTDVKELIKRVSKADASKEKLAEVKAEEAIENNNLKVFEEYTASLMNNQKQETPESSEKIDLTEYAVDFVQNDEVSVQPQITKVQDSEEMDFSDLTKKSSEKKDTKLNKETKITVQDLRTEKLEESEKQEPKLKTQLKVTSENTAVMTMNYAEDTVQTDVLSLNNQNAGANGSNFQTMLNNQIQASVPEFVKAGNIVLKDNNQGTINLILHPDDLGNVKIHLSLDGKTLTGHITVATKEALQVFKDNSETLREAFIKNGFDSANFEVSYGNSGNGNQNFAFEERNDGTNLFGKQMYGSVAGNAISNENTENSGIQEHFGNYSVNIVA